MATANTAVAQQSIIILGTNQDLWVAAQRHNECEPSELVEMFRTMRYFNLALSKAISPADLKRTGQHNERGPESLAVMLRMLSVRSCADFRCFTLINAAATGDRQMSSASRWA